MSAHTDPNIAKSLLKWYRVEHRDLPWRRSTDPWAIWVSEVMLQQTRVQTVIPYYHRFLSRFPNAASLAEATVDEALKEWEGLGYYARVRNLQRAARVVIDTHAGAIPEAPAEFRQLPGVGDYICAAVQSIAFGHPLAVVDGNVKRVLARLFCIDEPVNGHTAMKAFEGIAAALLPRHDPGDFNQAMMELGATVCTPKSPTCGSCPLSPSCYAYRGDLVWRYPVRAPRKKTPEYHVAVGVIRDGDRVLITRRPEEGLLGGLWEFPGGKVRDGETAENACIREIKEEVSLDVEIEGFVTRVRHAYTHFRVEIDVFRCRSAGGDVRLRDADDFRWITMEEIENYAFPGANRKFIPLLRDD